MKNRREIIRIEKKSWKYFGHFFLFTAGDNKLFSVRNFKRSASLKQTKNKKQKNNRVNKMKENSVAGKNNPAHVTKTHAYTHNLFG